MQYSAEPTSHGQTDVEYELTVDRSNTMKRKLADADGGIVTIAFGPVDGELIEHLGQTGFDAVWLETEHGPIDFADIMSLTRAADVAGITPLVRVSEANPGIIYRSLDCGANAIAVPHVKTAAQASEVVRAAKFGPVGMRGNSFGRRSLGVRDWHTASNEDTFIMVIIEDVEGVDNLPAILDVDHIDAFFVAPVDLSQSMGLVGRPDHPDVSAAVDAAISQIAAAGRTPGTLPIGRPLSHYVDLGVRLFLVPWIDWVLEGGREYLGRAGRANAARR